MTQGKDLKWPRLCSHLKLQRVPREGPHQMIWQKQTWFSVLNHFYRFLFGLMSSLSITAYSNKYQSNSRIVFAYIKQRFLFGFAAGQVNQW